jgi:hypothetical protein
MSCRRQCGGTAARTVAAIGGHRIRRVERRVALRATRSFNRHNNSLSLNFVGDNRVVRRLKECRADYQSALHLSTDWIDGAAHKPAAIDFVYRQLVGGRQVYIAAPTIQSGQVLLQTTPDDTSIKDARRYAACVVCVSSVVRTWPILEALILGP